MDAPWKKTVSRQISDALATQLPSSSQNTHTGTYDQYCRTYEDSLLPSLNPFGVYLKECLKNNHITQQQTFLQAQIPEGYGYKLLSGEKRPGKEMWSCGSAMPESLRWLRHNRLWKNMKCRSFTPKFHGMHCWWSVLMTVPAVSFRLMNSFAATSLSHLNPAACKVNLYRTYLWFFILFHKCSALSQYGFFVISHP